MKVDVLKQDVNLLDKQFYLMLFLYAIGVMPVIFFNRRIKYE